MTTIALAGCAHIHVPAFLREIRSRPALATKWVYDASPARAKHAAEYLSAAIAPDVATIANDADVAAAVVCSETDRHQAIVEPLAARGKHLFVEKPLGLGARDAYEMAEMIERSGVRFQTGYFMRGLGVVRTLKRLVDDGFFGTISRARASNCHRGALAGWFDAKPADPANDWRWMADPKHAGVGGFGDLATHALDVLIHLLGPVSDVTAALDPVTRRYPNCDETGEALLRFERGTIATIAAGWIDVDNPVTFQISGTKGSAHVIDGKLHLKRLDADVTSVLSDPLPDAPHAFDLFLNALEGKRDDVELVTAREAAYRSGVMEAIYEAARSGRWLGVGRGL